jgi:MFS family permease
VLPVRSLDRETPRWKPDFTLNPRFLIYATAFARSLATSMGAVMLGGQLARLDFAEGEIAFVVGIGLAGATLAAIVATFLGDRLGRRALLLELSLLMAAGGATIALSSSPLVIGAAAFVGLLNGMGRDRGASLILEQAILPSLTSDEHRTRTFAWYNVMQDSGGALGALAAGLPLLFAQQRGIAELAALRGGFGAYAGLLAFCALLYLFLPRSVEAEKPRGFTVTPHARRVVFKISALFSIDALGGGFITRTLMVMFFVTRFGHEGVNEATVGQLYFLALIANILSHFGAAWLGRRIGLVNTMVFTHIPSSLLLITVAIAPNFWVAAALLLIRESLVEMDVPTRQSYVMAVVNPEERTFASGVTGIVRMAGWAIAATFAGLLLRTLELWTLLVIGAGMKIFYDLALWYSFRHLKPPEER